jgi:hypothetical protein
MNGVALHALAGPIFEVASPRIPMAEEEVLKTFQCGFESHRGYPQKTASELALYLNRSGDTSAPSRLTVTLRDQMYRLRGIHLTGVPVVVAAGGLALPPRWREPRSCDRP